MAIGYQNPATTNVILDAAQAAVGPPEVVREVIIEGSAANLITSQVSVTGSVALIYTPQASSIGVMITNLGSTDVWIGGSGVTPSTGQLLPGVRGAAISLPTIAPIYAVTGGASQSVCITEIYYTPAT